MSQRHSMRLVESKRDELSDVDIVDGDFDKALSTWTLQQPDALSPAQSQMSTKIVERKPSQVSHLSLSIPVNPIPQPSAPPSTPFPPSTSKWGVFDQKAVHSSSPINTGAPAFQFSTFPQQIVAPGAGPPPSPHKPAPTGPVSVFETKAAPWVPSPGSFPAPSGLPKFSFPVSRTGSVFTPPLPSLPTPQPREAPIPLTVPADILGPPAAKPVSPDTKVPATPEPASPPRPTTEELLLEQQQELRRAMAVAQAQADRHFRFQTMFKVFTLWKRNVMNRGQARELKRARKEQFKRSIKDMGLSNTATDVGKGKQKAEYHIEEDLVSWEDTSQASSSPSLRKRSRRSIKRADDEATLVAIKEVCWLFVMTRVWFIYFLPTGRSNTSQTLGTWHIFIFNYGSPSFQQSVTSWLGGLAINTTREHRHCAMASIEVWRQ